MNLHGLIMNLPCNTPSFGRTTSKHYKEGHRDARHAAAELASVDEAARVAPLVAQRDWFQNALEHIAASCGGRASEVATEALKGRRW
jgi:hypothetical protein